MAEDEPKIIIRRNGPYIVQGGIPLIRKSPVMSEHGEPLTWRKDEVLKTGNTYTLCRCGRSSGMPFCDSSHADSDSDFQGEETADTGPIEGGQQNYPGTAIVVKNDRSLCMHAGFCGNRVTNVWQMVPNSGDTQIRAQIISMIERCPSGALAYSLEAGEKDIEPNLPVEIAVTPNGALWVSGNISIERADGKPFAARNRVTLCRCGASKNKPLCDGTHKDIGFSSR